jgi:hypothetical protein
MLSHMKTTVELPDELLIRAKKRSAETRTPLRVLIERGLRRELSSSSARGGVRHTARKIKWVVAPGGLPPGLDVSDRSSLHDWIRSPP